MLRLLLSPDWEITDYHLAIDPFQQSGEHVTYVVITSRYALVFQWPSDGVLWQSV